MSDAKVAGDSGQTPAQRMAEIEEKYRVGELDTPLADMRFLIERCRALEKQRAELVEQLDQCGAHRTFKRSDYGD